VQVTGSAAAAAFGSEFDFRRVVVDARRFLALGGGRVVAVQGVVETTGGAAPFDQVSLVGNSNYLRGYTRGRFRDRHLAASRRNTARRSPAGSDGRLSPAAGG
jgi:hypothetical protein